METYSTLADALSRFCGADGNEVALADQFRVLADYLLRGGYVSVNGTRRVYLCDIEFYYHEEEGPVKDPVMYHRNTPAAELPYLPLGSLYPHVSGIDIAFESSARRYRASALVRGYNLLDGDAPLPVDYETRSTYLYEALLCGRSLDDGIRLAWVATCLLRPPQRPPLLPRRPQAPLPRRRRPHREPPPPPGPPPLALHPPNPITN